MLYIDSDQSALENVQKTLNVVKQIINVSTHVPMDNSVINRSALKTFHHTRHVISKKKIMHRIL